jgi:lipoyl(octanoyl) transferase
VRTLHAHRLGRIPYAEAHALQERLVVARKEGRIGDVLLLLEHPKVITLGRAAKPEHVLLDAERLSAQGYERFEIGRGGDVTFHGPGQLVAYPIVDLAPDRQDVRKYVRWLEETMIRVCADYGVTATRSEGFNGTWVGDRKVGAVGVRISRWITMHGFALNVNTQLSDFSAIVACGIRGRGVTSLQELVGRELSMHEVEAQTAQHFAGCMDASLTFVDGPPSL